MKSSKSSSNRKRWKEKTCKLSKRLRKENDSRRRSVKSLKISKPRRNPKLTLPRTSTRISSTLFMRVFLTSIKRLSITRMWSTKLKRNFWMLTREEEKEERRKLKMMESRRIEKFELYLLFIIFYMYILIIYNILYKFNHWI